ncbi:hypothetical protein BDV18DRAFT_155671 [Aspergillus unguis]
MPSTPSEMRCPTACLHSLSINHERVPPNDNTLSVDDTFSEWLNSAFPPTDLNTNITKELLQPLEESTSHELPLPEETVVALPEPQTVTLKIAYDPMIQLYYQNFHPSHPIMIPRKALNSLYSLIPPQMFHVMRYIGAHYYPDQSLQQGLRQAAFSCLSDQSIQDGFRVQALLLLAIADHSHCQQQSAHQLMQTAIDLALKIGMNLTPFAREHSHGHPVVEESWRRTYWELYVVEGLIAATHDQTSSRLYHQLATVHLPCDERMYDHCNVIPSGQALHDLKSQSALDQTFSTFAYRISAVQAVGTVLELNRSLERSYDSHVETIDAHLSSSLMELPSLHGDGYDSSYIDEMVFQTQMTLYLALIYLHHPRSSMQFASFRISPPTSCTRMESSSQIDLPCSTQSSQPLDIHSHKLLRAADLLSGLATLPSPIQRRSPFFTCALAMCIIVHTAARLLGANDEKKEAIESRIQLGFGALKVLGKVWPLPSNVRMQMVDMYQEVAKR